MTLALIGLVDRELTEQCCRQWVGLRRSALTRNSRSHMTPERVDAVRDRANSYKNTPRVA